MTYSIVNLLVFLVSGERRESLQSYTGGKESPQYHMCYIGFFSLLWLVPGYMSEMRIFVL